MSITESKSIKHNTQFTDYVLLILIAASIIAGLLLSPSFLSVPNLQNIMFSCCVYGILAIGQTMVMLVKEIDLTIGSMIAFSTLLAIDLNGRILGVKGIGSGNFVQGNWTLIVLLALAIGVVMGFIIGAIVVFCRIPSLIATLGVMTAISGYVYILSGGYSLYLTKMANVKWLGNATVGVIPVCFIIFLCIGAILWLLLKFSKFGARIYAVGGNERAAQYAGINTGKWKIIAFTISGFCAAVAAVIYCSRNQAAGALQGSGYEMTAIAICVIGGVTLEGGKGELLGTMLAALTLSIILNILSLVGLKSWYQTLTCGLIIIAAALMHNYKSDSYTRRRGKNISRKLVKKEGVEDA